MQLNCRGAAVPADTAQVSRSVFFFFALIHREEIKYSKTWLTVAELLQERARSTNRVRGDVTGCEGLWQDGVNNWRI